MRDSKKFEFTCQHLLTLVQRRYYDEHTKVVYAVKKLPKSAAEYNFLFTKEYEALTRMAEFQVPRVSKYINLGNCSDGALCLVLQLIEGVSLRQSLTSKSNFVGGGQEARMLTIAVQLLEATICHLDLSPTNILLQEKSDHRWGTVWVIDFGFATLINPGAHRMQAVLDIHTQEVQPTGATTDYASPEQLRSLQIQFERREHEDLLINGASSDMFSVGVVLYEQLTGVLPFQPVEHISRSAPASVPEELKGRWEEYEAMSQAHRLWEGAVVQAHHSGSPVKHPLLDKVRECSAKPDDAADFFQKILHPYFFWRLSTRAILHPYVAALYREMREFEDAREETGGATMENAVCKIEVDNESKSEASSETHSETDSESESEDEDVHTVTRSQSAPAAVQRPLSSEDQACSGRMILDTESVKLSLAFRRAPEQATDACSVAEQPLAALQAQRPSAAQQADQPHSAQHSQAVQLTQAAWEAPLSQHAEQPTAADGFSLCVAIGKEQDAERAQAAAQQQAAPMATSEHSSSGLLLPLYLTKKNGDSADMAGIAPGAARAAAAGRVEGDRPSWVGSNPGSSSKHKPMLKLKSFLARRLLPGCLRGAGTVTPSDEQEDVLCSSWPQFDGGAMDVQPLPPAASSCDEQQPGATSLGFGSSVHSTSSLVVLKDRSSTSQPAPKQVQLVATSADSSTGQQQQQQDLLECKKAVSMPVMSGAAEEAATQASEQAGLIAALRQPSGLAQQAETTATDEPAHQGQADDAILHVYPLPKVNNARIADVKQECPEPPNALHIGEASQSGLWLSLSQAMKLPLSVASCWLSVGDPVTFSVVRGRQVS
ncbi:hypothetical protein ABBQ38_004538 [Trebouxia sp. C0009 RCD-2024]